MAIEKLTTTFGNLELYLERVTPGAPTAAAAKGAICVNLVDPNVYENLDGATTWRRFAGDNALLRFIVSPDGPYTSINDAILAASAAFIATGNAQVVLVAPGTYTELVTLRRGVSVQGFPSEPLGSPILVGRVLCALGAVAAQIAWVGVNINNASANPAITYTGSPGQVQILAVEGCSLASGGKGLQSSGGDLSNQVILTDVFANAGATVGLFVDMITGGLTALGGHWSGTAGSLHVGGVLATSRLEGVRLDGNATIDVATTVATFDTCDFTALLVNNAVAATVLKNVRFTGVVSPTVTGAGAVILAGAMGAACAFPLFTTAPVRVNGDGPAFAYDSSGDPVGTWAVSNPTTYNEAIRRMAAVVSTGATVPIP